MNEYMLIFRNAMLKGHEKPTVEQMQTMVTQWQNWIIDISYQGKYGSTNRLLSEGKTIKPGKVVIEGPFVEAKEMVGGYLIIKSDNLDEAVELAKSCPSLDYGGTVEVRNVMAIDHNPDSATFLNEVAHA
jgi:hypothetical protein